MVVLSLMLLRMMMVMMMMMMMMRHFHCRRESHHLEGVQHPQQEDPQQSHPPVQKWRGHKQRDGDDDGSHEEGGVEAALIMNENETQVGKTDEEAQERKEQWKDAAVAGGHFSHEWNETDEKNQKDNDEVKEAQIVVAVAAPESVLLVAKRCVVDWMRPARLPHGRHDQKLQHQSCRRRRRRRKKKKKMMMMMMMPATEMRRGAG